MIESAIKEHIAEALEVAGLIGSDYNVSLVYAERLKGQPDVPYPDLIRSLRTRLIAK